MDQSHLPLEIIEQIFDLRVYYQLRMKTEIFKDRYVVNVTIKFHLFDGQIKCKSQLDVCASPAGFSKTQDMQVDTAKFADRIRKSLFRSLDDDSLTRRLSFVAGDDWKFYNSVVFMTTQKHFIFEPLELKRSTKTEKMVLRLCEDINNYVSTVAVDAEYTVFLEKLFCRRLAFFLPTTDQTRTPKITEDLWIKVKDLLHDTEKSNEEQYLYSIVLSGSTIKLYHYIRRTKGHWVTESITAHSKISM